MAIHNRGSAEKILLWPLGGLSFIDYERSPQHQIQVSGIGPLSSLLLSALFFGILAATGIPMRWDYVLPFEHWMPREFSLTQIFLLHAARLNLILALFNLLIPAYPLDGGQVLFGFLSLKFGRLRAAKAMVFISIPIGAAIAFFGLSAGMIMLAFIGLSVIFEGVQLRKLIQAGDIDAHPVYGGGPEFQYMPDRPEKKGFFAKWREKRARAAMARDAERNQAARARVDAVLEKVSREGIGSLTSEEKRVLDEASRRGRGEA
jgi:Zn-dependent protease